MTGPYNYGPAPDYDAELAAAHNPALPQDQLLRLWHTRPDLREALAQLPACPPNLAAQVKFSDPWRDPNARSHRGIIMAFAMLAGLLVVVGLGYVGYMAVHGDGSTQQQTHGMLPPNDPKTTSSATMTTTAPPPVQSSPIKPVDLSTNCVQAEDGTDSNGVKYVYDPAKAFDNDPLTAWRCQWKEQDGQSITAKFDHPTLVTSVGLVPGYAKTDIDGSDRFAQNRKITRVRWEFSDGSSVKQQVPVSRALASVKVNVVTDSVTMVIEATEPGVSIVNKSGQRQDAFNGLVSVSEIEIMGTQPPAGEGPAPAPAPAPPPGAAPAAPAAPPHGATPTHGAATTRAPAAPAQP
ncbi:discoidin domain-containing protein [Mycobacterium sp. D16R24]|uniref:discoidin domain-containing protein n=1 Tax=Mycobacterium sp. D16R24 TaxID=1855656 RepID=UPI000991FD15|nr:discoidin domain-containing protein [Mycobacterium sp. D16R24]